MKRKKDSAAAARATSQRGNEAKRKVEEAKSDELCPYFDNLPSHLTAHILLQLPMKYLLICKCVCKNWKTMISESHFAKLHFEQAPTSLMIRTDDFNRTMHFLECEPEKFEIGSKKHNIKKRKHRLNIHLGRKGLIIKLPLRDAKSFSEKRLNNHNDKFKVVNSCNGFLCLCDNNNIPLVICNPITGEFIRLPVTLNKARVTMVGQAGFGFHSKTNEYKVIDIWRRSHEFKSLILEIHTLGTLSWRNVEVDLKISIWDLQCPTCVNDALHWIRGGYGKQISILCFNFESERLQLFPSPQQVFGITGKISMGEIRGFLYICDISSSHDITLWVMNEYGIGESWTKVYNIDTSAFSLFNDPVSRHYGLCWPIKHFKEDTANAILLFNSYNCFIYYEPEKNEFKVFDIQGTNSKLIEVITHIPSLISLKDVVKGGNIEVLNIHSRCAKFKLREENEVFVLSQIV